MKKILIFITIFQFCTAAFGLTADEIIKQVDKNMTFDSQKATAVMTVNRDGKKLVKEFIVYGVREGNKFYAEYTNPEDRGVKYLKLDKELWIYFPDADDIMKISGHMLRQGMMGSDISYEDMLSDEEYREKYNAEFIGETVLDGVKVYEIDLIAKKADATYYKEKMLIDKEKIIPMEINLYAKSGRKIKRIKMSQFKSFGKRYYPMVMTIKDLRKKDSVTYVEYKELEFDIPISDSYFSKQMLRR